MNYFESYMNDHVLQNSMILGVLSVFISKKFSEFSRNKPILSITNFFLTAFSSLILSILYTLFIFLAQTDKKIYQSIQIDPYGFSAYITHNGTKYGSLAFFLSVFSYLLFKAIEFIRLIRTKIRQTHQNTQE